MKKKQKKTPKERNPIVPIMVEHCKGGPMKDKKKDKQKYECRRQIKEDI
jgi:hypothetical protein